MSKFYRNRRGFFSALSRGGGLWLSLGATGLILLCIAGFLLSPKEDGTKDLLASSDRIPSPSVSETGSSSDSVGSADVSDVFAEDSADLSVSAPTEDSEETVSDVMMQIPVNGAVGTGFSLTVPVFSETMKDWRVHQGIDYKTDGEAEVYAAADGIVDQVYTCELMGLTVEILHADGNLSVYQSLSGEPYVISGQEVRKGDVIGATGVSADCECLEGTHLHFALIRDGIYLDPQDRFEP